MTQDLWILAIAGSIIISVVSGLFAYQEAQHHAGEGEKPSTRRITRNFLIGIFLVPGVFVVLVLGNVFFGVIFAAVIFLVWLFFNQMDKSS